jgi:hypothetical protein
MSENIICQQNIIFQSARGLLESEQTYELVLNVGDGNIEESERSEQFMIEASGRGRRLCMFIHRVRIILFLALF